MVLTHEQWAVLGPMVEACRPQAKVPPFNLRRTVAAIIWRHANGAKWRAIPAAFGPWRASHEDTTFVGGPWWMAAQLFIRWARLGVWDRLLGLALECRVTLGMAFLDTTSMRAHQKAAGAAKKGELAQATAAVKRLADLVVDMAPRPS